MKTTGATAVLSKTGACLDCDVDLSFSDTGCGHDYMVHDEIWHQAVPDGHGALCLFCLSARLQRPLVLDDFELTPMQILLRWREYDRVDGVKPRREQRLRKSIVEAAIIEQMLHEQGSFGFGATISHQQRQEWRGRVHRRQKEEEAVLALMAEDDEVVPTSAKAAVLH